MDRQKRRELLEKVRNYDTPVEAVKLLKQSPPLIIAGVSSVGKNTVADAITKLSDYQRVITCTTRQPRDQERHGVNYWFIDETEIAELIEARALIEVQLVHGETIYGTTTEAYGTVVESGRRPLLLLDIYGALKFIRHVPQLEVFFLLPPNFEEWMRRFQKRGQISYTEQASRLKTAKTEMEAALQARQVEIVINRDINLTAEGILQGRSGPEAQASVYDIAKQLLDRIGHF